MEFLERCWFITVYKGKNKLPKISLLSFFFHVAPTLVLLFTIFLAVFSILYDSLGPSFNSPSLWSFILFSFQKLCFCPLFRWPLGPLSSFSSFLPLFATFFWIRQCDRSDVGCNLNRIYFDQGYVKVHCLIIISAVKENSLWKSVHVRLSVWRKPFKLCDATLKRRNSSFRIDKSSNWLVLGFA